MAPAAARAALESLLRDRKLDTTLTSALPLWDPTDTERVAPTGWPVLDRDLHGGLPRGQLSEIVGPASSGRTSLLMAAFAAATARGELVAVVDVLDRFDPPSAEACGVDLRRVLWIRGEDVPLSRQSLAPDWEPSRARPGRRPGSLVGRALARGLKAFNLVLQSGGFGVVALDLADVPSSALGDLPFTTWLRLQRVLEGGTTAAVLLAAHSVSRSAGGVSVRLSQAHEQGTAARPRRPSACPSVRGALPSREFQRAVMASRRPFLGQERAGLVAGRWTGSAPQARRFHGLATQASVVRAAGKR